MRAARAHACAALDEHGTYRNKLVQGSRFSVHRPFLSGEP